MVVWFGGGYHAADLSSLSAPRATIRKASSGSGRCSALASSQGARIQDVALLVGGQDHRHSFWMDRLDDGVRRRRQEAVDLMRARQPRTCAILAAHVSLELVDYDQGDWERTLCAWPTPIPFE